MLSRRFRAVGDRISDWKQRIGDEGGEWRVVNDIDRLESAVALR